MSLIGSLSAFPVCGFRWLTGLPCPLCGMTHAFLAMARGHFAEAMHYHPLAPLALLLIAGAICAPRRMAPLWSPSLAAFLVFGVCRAIFS